MKRNRPFVVATFAMTADGKITTKNFSPVDFTSREDKLHLFRQRALADAVLVGYTTLQRDNVRLGIPPELCGERLKRGQTPAPIRVIISNKGKIDNQLKIFQSDPAKAGPILIFSTARMPKRIRTALQRERSCSLANRNVSIWTRCYEFCAANTASARLPAKAVRLCFDRCSNAGWSINSILPSRLICSAEPAPRR
jgi:riboflavin biosynthesis pyrimidine reductase